MDPQILLSAITGTGGAVVVLWLWNRYLMEQIERLELKHAEDVKSLTKNANNWMRLALNGTNLAKAMVGLESEN